MENDEQQPGHGLHLEVASLEQNSPSSPVCYIDLSDYNTTPHTTLNDSIDNHEDVATPGRTTPSASGDESDHTPRSEVPSTAQSPAPWNIASNSLQPQTAISEVEYFSSQPRPYLSNLPPSTYTDLSYAQTPHNSQASQAYNYLRSRPEFEIVTASHAQLEPSESTERPQIHRDASSTSTASASTIKANYGRIDFGNHPPPRDYRDYPQYPNQSYLALQSQSHPHTQTHQPSPLRTRGFQLSQQASHSASQVTTLRGFVTQEQYFDPSSRTVGNTPAGSPGLFSPSTPPVHRTEEGGFYASPYLHHTQRQAPRETHVADVTVDSISGRKVINDYEVIDELGRGVHGKVKLGRNLATGQFIAIKIIDRNAKRRRLGKNDSHEEKIRREVAILKKVRHSNVVSLLEVIDDPKAKKVYLILEHVELGEVKWRKPGASEIIRVEYRRVLRESKGIFDSDAATQEDQQIITRAARRRERVERQKWTELLHLRPNSPGVEHWSFEHGGASDEDVENDAILHALSRKAKDIPEEEKTIEASISPNRRSTVSLSSAQSVGQFEADTGLEGTMYGAYEAEIPRGRTPSVAGSSDPESTEEDTLDDVPEHFQYVPLMTLAGARAAIRDTVLGLEYLHYQGVIHRDIKPANLLQTRDHRIKISDFGVSYLGRIPRDESDGYQSESDAPDDDDGNMDNPIELAKTVGTPAFFAPELCDIDPEAEIVPVTQAIDVWALGVTLFCLVFGRVPFYTDNISKWAIMPVIAHEKVYIPRKRLRALDDRSSSRPNSHGRNKSISSQKRSAHELEYEDVDDDLYDLLRRLLIKDPRKRITLKEVKRHPWVLADIVNKVAWVDETEPERQMKGKRIELTHEDLNHAVIPINAFERLGFAVKKTLATVGNVIGSSLGRTGSSRKRAKSTATSEGGPPSARSSSSTISQDARKVRDERRPSLRVDEFHAALRHSRDGDHPLSHSLTASPEARNHKQFFLGSASRPHSPQTQIPEESTPLSKYAGHNRPYALNRAQSAMSTTTSIKTIRQSDFTNNLHAVSPEAQNSPLPSENTGGSRINGFISDARHRLRSYKSRDKFSKKLTEHSRERSVEKILGREEDGHAEPSLAWSSAVAAGHVEQPLPLREYLPKQHAYPNSLMSTPSVVGTDRLHPDSRHGTPSRQSSISSMSSRPFDSVMGYDERPVTRGSISNHSQQYESSDEQFKRAKEEQMRKLRLEESLNRERPKSVAGYGQSEQISPGACPPSPDDDVFRQKIKDGVFDKGEPVRASFALGTSSSSEDQLASGMSQSASNPSIPSVKSQSSSIAPEDMAPLEAAKVSDASIYQNHPYDSEGYAGDHVVESEDDDEESDDEDFIVMTKRKPAHVAPRSESLSNAERSRRAKNQSLSGVSQKSTRSGSGGTLRKLRSHSTPEEDAPRGRAISPDV